jgi:hypothetical protein
MMDVASPKKGPKMPKKHEKQKCLINVLPKGVLVKFFTTHAKRSEQSDSRLP